MYKNKLIFGDDIFKIAFWYVRNRFAMTAVDVSSENNSLHKSLVKSRNKQNSRLCLYVTEKYKEKNYKDR